MGGLLFFSKGIILGFSIAAPVGPIGVLCIRRTLGGGMLYGFLSGLGAATADGIYGCIAAFGLTAVSSFLLDKQFVLRLLGGGFLLYLGFFTFRAIPAGDSAGESGKSFAGAYFSTFFLTVSNPMTILSFLGVFAGLGLADAGRNVTQAGAMVLGVVSGSMLWWLVLSGTVSLFRSKFDQGKLLWVNRVSGLLIGGFGVLALVSLR